MTHPTGDALAAYENGQGDLLPCPFCGGKPYESRQGVICCDDCGACPVFKPDVMENKAAWNTRQHSEPVNVEHGVDIGEVAWSVHCETKDPDVTDAVINIVAPLILRPTTQSTGRDDGMEAIKALMSELWWCGNQLGLNWKDAEWRSRSSVGRAYDKGEAALAAIQQGGSHD